MYYLVYQCPTQFGFSGVYEVTDKIQLVSGGPFRVMQNDSAGQFASQTNCFSFFFIQNVGLTPPPLKPLKELKQLVLFWSFLFQDGVSHDFLERSHSCLNVRQSVPSAFVSPDNRVDLRAIRIPMSLEESVASFELRDLYHDYLSSEPELKQWVALYMFNPSRGIINQAFSLYDNYRITTSFTWTILEALSGYKDTRCVTRVPCPKGCHDVDDPDQPAFARATHPTTSLRQRIRDLLKPFPDAEYLLKIAMTVYEDDRCRFYHAGEARSLPPTKDGKIGMPLTASRTNVKLYGKEGLETHDAIILLRDAARCLLLNRLFPKLNFYPRFSPLMSVSNRI